MKRTCLLSLFSLICAIGYCAVPDSVGYWQFNGDPNVPEDDVLVADIGNDLVLVGGHGYVDGIDKDDGYAVSIGVGSHFVCSHGIAPNGGGAMVNEWTLLVDFSFPQSSVGSFIDFFQTNSDNETDSDWTIHRDDQAIGIAAVGYSRDVGFFVSPDTWYRMMISVDNGTSFDVYVDGAFIFSGNIQDVDGRFALEDTLLLFAANDGDDNEIYVSTVAMWDRPLTASQIEAIGGAGGPIVVENTPPEVDAGANVSVEMPVEGSLTINLDATVFDDDNDDLVVEWTKVSGPNEISFIDSSVTDAEAIIAAPGTYILQISVDDSEFTAFDTVVISALNNGYNNLLVDWKFEEVWNGSTILDTSGNNKHGSVIDGTAASAAYVEGKVDNALDLGNAADMATNGDYISVDMVMPDSGSIAFWYYVPELYNYQSLFDNSIQQDDWEMWIYGDSRARFRIQGDSVVTANLNNLSSDGNAIDEWFHFAVTWQRTSEETVDVALYVNGDLIETDSGSWVDPGYQFYLGGGHVNNELGAGVWDEFQIYDKTLSLSEIRSLVWADNQPPIVDAGPDLTMWLPEEGGATFNLSGSVEDAGGPGELTIEWTKVSGPNEISFIDSSQPDTQVTILEPGTFHLAIEANDGQFTVSDEVIINVYAYGYTGLVAYWTFDDDSLVDTSGEGNDGTYLDGSVGTSAYVPGKLGKALDLQNGDYLIDGDSVSLSHVMTDSGSIAFWYKVLNLYNYQALFDNSIQQDDWEMWIYGDSRARFRIQGDSYVTANLNNLSSDGNSVDEWFHFVVTWQRTSETTVDVALYVNGDLIETDSGSWVDPGSTFFLAGGHAGNDYGDGIWDEVRIYERILTPEEISSIASLSDFDNDLDVDMDDLAILASLWLTGTEGCESTPLGDYNVDCQVNLEDLAGFAQHFLLGVE